MYGGKHRKRVKRDSERDHTANTGVFSKKRGFPAKQQKPIFSSVSVGYDGLKIKVHTFFLKKRKLREQTEKKKLKEK